MDILTIYSQSHEKLFKNYFLESFRKTNQHNNLIIKRFEQISQTGEYRKPGWEETVVKKIEFILDHMKKSKAKYFVYADADILFLREVTTEFIKSNLIECNICFQKDKESYCTGFFACKNNATTKKFFEEVLQVFEICDQYTINQLIKKNRIKARTFDEQIYSIWRITKSVWDGVKPIKLPQKIPTVFHANFTIGEQNKEKLLLLANKTWVKSPEGTTKTI